MPRTNTANIGRIWKAVRHLKLPKLGIWAFAAGALHKHTHDDATKGGEERSEDDSASKMRHAQRP
jgi:hypothetical protein